MKHRLPYLVSGTNPAESNREWTRFTHPTHGYQVSIPSTWAARRAEENFNSWAVPDNAAGFSVSVNRVTRDFDLEDMAKWRIDVLRQMSGTWEIGYPVGVWGIPPTHDEPGKVIHAHIVQTATEYCIEGVAELWTVAARSPTQNYAYLLIAGVCQHSFDLYDSTRWDIVESFKVAGSSPAP